MEIQAPQSFHKFAGNDCLLTFTVTDSADAVVDITGMTVSAVVARRTGTAAVLSTEASPATLTASLSDPTNGVFTLSATDTATDALLGTYEYQVKITDLASDETTVNHGYLTFKAKMV